MWWRTRVLRLLGIVLALFALPLGAQRTPEPVVEVLCLHSYHPADWTDAIMAGYRDAFDGMPHVTFHVEYMDTKRIQTPAYLAQLAALYQMKYAGTSFDGILVSDDHALAFVLQHRDQLFPGVPVAFCGVNRFEPAMLGGTTDVTGVVEQGDFAKTLDFILQVRPKMQALHVICDATRTGRLNLEALQAVVREAHPSLKLKVLDSASLATVREALRDVPEDDAAFFISFWSEADGHAVSVLEQSGLIESSPVPVFGRSEWLMGKGLAGGLCVRGQRQGEAAGSLIRKALGGVDIESLPVVMTSPNEFMVDLAVFRRYRLPQGPIPPDAVRLNGLRPVLEVHRSVAWMTLALIGALVLVVGVLVLNLQARRRHARQLSASEAKYREVFDGVGDAIFVHDAATGRVLDVNSTMLRMYRATRDQALSLPLDTFCSGEDQYTGDEAARRVSETRDGDPRTYAWHARRCDGSTFWAQVMLTYSPNCREERVLAVVRDISEEREERARSQKLRESLVQARRLESLGLLAGGVAHDLNNMLGPVLAMPELIGEEMEDVLGGDRVALERVRKDLASIESAAARAAETVKDLLMLSRQGGVEKQSVDLAQVVESALASRELRAARAARPEVVVEFRKESVVPPLLGAATNLGRAITNVVRNALEAVAPDGHVVLTLTTCQLDHGIPGDPGTDPGTYARLSVCDDGCGIPADQVDRVFDPFFSKKARSTTSGTGMGLPIVHGIMRDHRGGVQLRSSIGEGTTLDLLLPLPREPLQTSKDAEHGEGSEGTETLWVVDDDPGQRLILQRILTMRGYQVETLASGEAALANIKEATKRPELLLMDYMMGGGLNGLEALTKIRAIAPQLKAAIISGLSDNDSLAEAQTLGASWICKPFTPDELVHQVRAMLDGDSPRAEASRSVRE